MTRLEQAKERLRHIATEIFGLTPEEAIGLAGYKENLVQFRFWWEFVQSYEMIQKELSVEKECRRIEHEHRRLL